MISCASCAFCDKVAESDKMGLIDSNMCADWLRAVAFLARG